jgi:hypothetical protein
MPGFGDPLAMRAAQFTVNVDCTGHGTWDGGLPQAGGTVRCGSTLEEAKRVARSSVGRGNRYELVIRDAYLRVLHRELIGANHEPPARPTQPRRQPLPAVT